MDLDVLTKEFHALKRRVLPMLEEFDAFKRRGDGMFGQSTSAAREHLERGNLDAAGHALGLDRSHDGAESDDSYERRLLAHLDGPEAAGATGPIEPALPPEAAGEQVDPSKGVKDDGTSLDPAAKPIAGDQSTGEKPAAGTNPNDAGANPNDGAKPGAGAAPVAAAD